MDKFFSWLIFVKKIVTCTYSPNLCFPNGNIGVPFMCHIIYCLLAMLFDSLSKWILEYVVNVQFASLWFQWKITILEFWLLWNCLQILFKNTNSFLHLIIGLEAWDIVRHLPDVDYHTSCHLLQHKTKSRLAYTANARQGLHCLCYG